MKKERNQWRSIARVLAETLIKYTHCRHGMMSCNCTKEAEDTLILLETEFQTRRDEELGLEEKDDGEGG